MVKAEIMNKGWIRIPRNFDEWEWYENSSCVHMFVHLMMKAAYKPKQLGDISIERGEVLTSTAKLAKELNLSVKQVRTILKKLEKTNSIVKKGASKYTKIKIADYEVYQGFESSETVDEGQGWGKVGARLGQGMGKIGATYKKEKKEEKEKNYIYNRTPHKNSFQDYDKELTEYEIGLIRARLERDRITSNL